MDPEPDDITFELERFGWASEDRLEVAGRWNGVRRRLARPTLVIVVGGRRRRLRTLPGAWGSSPEGWEATFGWEGEPVDLTGAELEVGRSIVVDLPPPRRLRQTAPAPAPSAEVAPEREVPAEPEAPPEVEAPAPLQGELDAARAEARAAREEAAAARDALEREQEEAAIARRALSAAREAEEDERSDAQSLRSELEELRGRHERAEEELAGARSELVAAQERVTAAVTAGREEAQQLHHEVARARASAAPPQSHEVEVEAGPSRRRFDPARSGERSRTKRFGSSRQEEPTPALVAERTRSVTERAAAWASGAAERARGALSGDSSPDTGTPREAPTAAAGRARPARARARSTQRAFDPDSRHETSWALRAVAVGLVAVLLVALALIVSFLT